MKNKIILFFVVCIIIGFAASFHKIVFSFSKNLYESKQYSNAYFGFRYLTLLKPQNSEYKYYFVKTLAELPPTFVNQKLMFEYSMSEADDSAKYEATQKVREWKASILKNVGKNYIEQAPLNSKILRWNKNSFPLKVYVDYNSLSDLPDYYKSSVNSALRQWEKSIEFISFVTTENKHNAQIIISFIPLPKDVCQGNVCRYVTGFTQPKLSGNTLKYMTINIYSKNPYDQFLSNKEIYNVLLHEIGHALGIWGHSYSTEDLMYQTAKDNYSIWAKYRSDFQYINGSDVNTINLLYMLYPDIIDVPESESSGLIYPPIIFGSPKEMAQRKLKEAQIYVKNAPSIFGGYVDMAQAYIELEEYNKAVNALNAALERAQTDNDRYYIYYTYAVAYMQLKRYDMAMKYAKLAKSINRTGEIEDLMSLIKVKELE